MNKKLNKSRKKLSVRMGHSISDANQGWVFTGVHDTGFFGGGKCNAGHRIRYAYIVQHPETNEEHVYGSQCITKFWINSYYKGIDPEKFNELYKKYRPMFFKFAKNLYQADKWGWELPLTFPQDFNELEKIAGELAEKVTAEIKRRRTLLRKWKKDYKKMKSKNKATKTLKERKEKFIKFCPEFAYLVLHRRRIGTIQNNFLRDVAKDFVDRYAKYGSVHNGDMITEKQRGILKQINDILEGKVGNPTLANKLKNLMYGVGNPWLKNNFLPSVIRQLETKTDLSEKQWNVLKKNKIDVDSLKNDKVEDTITLQV